MSSKRIQLAVVFFLFAISFLSGYMTPGMTGAFYEKEPVSELETSSLADQNLPDHPPNFTDRSVEDVRFAVLEDGKKQLFDGHYVELQTSVVKINGDGYRDKIHRVEKPENTTRIIALGDSVTFGWGVNQSDIWTEGVERGLNENSTYNYQVMNFGVWAYNTSMEVKMLEEKGLKYDPDAVIVQYNQNDAINMSLRSRLLDEYEKELEEKYSGSNLSERAIQIQAQRMANIESRKRRDRMPVEEAMAGVKYPLSRLEDMSSKNEFDVYVMGWMVDEDQSNHLKELCEKFGFEYIDMRSELEIYHHAGHYRDNPYRVQDGHPNEKGHRLIAQGILDSVNREDFR